MFLKREKPEMNNFERKKSFCFKGKILEKFSIFLENFFINVFNGCPRTISQNIFAYLAAAASAKNAFFYVLP